MIRAGPEKAIRSYADAKISYKALLTSDRSVPTNWAHPHEKTISLSHPK